MPRIVTPFRFVCFMCGADALLAQARDSAAPLVVAPALLGLLCALGIFFVLVSRRLRRRSRATLPESRARGTAVKPVGQNQAARLDLSRRERDELLENARLLARENPGQTAKLLRSWLKDD